MRRSVKAVMCMTVVFIVMIFGSLLYAGCGDPDTPPGVPPYGVAIQSDAAGTKLTGVISIEYGAGPTTREGMFYYKSRILLRLKKGNEVKTFYAEGDLPSDPVFQQAVITELLKDKILGAFFGGKALTITLTTLGEFKFLPAYECKDNPKEICSKHECLANPNSDPHCCEAEPACHDDYIMADIALAVK
jgi:hypothetical protein